MKVVMFARVPAWYSFRHDRLAKRLQAEGHEIAGIVVEKVATHVILREWLYKLGPRIFVSKALKRIFGRSATRAPAQPDRQRAALRSCDAPVHHVAAHNSDECFEIITRLDPEVLVLRGCRLIRNRILEIPRIGTINPHYALLPAYRGMEVTEWSVLHGDPCAVSVHWVLEALDTGSVIVSRPIEVRPGDSLGDLREKCAALAVDLLAEALRRIERDRIRRVSLPAPGGRQYFAMHPRLRRLAESRLRST